MKKIVFTYAGVFVALLAFSCSKAKYDGDSRYASFSADGVEFRVAENKWDVDMRGNHRALVSIDDSHSEAVVVDLPWRRPDLRIDTKKIIVTDTSGNEIRDVAVTLMTREKGQIVFRPMADISDYYVYYLPFKFRHGYNDARYGDPWNDYLPPVYEADSLWAASAVENEETLPHAKVQYIESRTRFNFWSPMGLVATEDEMAAIKAASGQEMIVFPEDRAFPIQLRDQLPCRWNVVPEPEFQGYALRNEYYTWQLGVWAAGKQLDNVRVEFSDLRNCSDTIPAKELTCFNQEGTNWDGKHVTFTINVPESKVQALWCGVQIPENAKRGVYHGTATVTADNADPQTIDLDIEVSSDILRDKGDGEEWRHARLRWLNSTIAMDDEPTAPFSEMALDGNRIEATGKTVTVGSDGMVQSIVTNGNEVFAKPQKFVVSTTKGEIVFSADNLKIEKVASGLVSWTASSNKSGINFDLSANMEFDGHMHYDILLSSEEDTEVSDVRLVSVYTPYASLYSMGCGMSGGYRPESFSWNWDGPYDSYWIGGAEAGLHTEFRGGTYHGPLINDYKPAPTPVWSNGGLGRVTFSGAKGQPATVVASTGKTTLTGTPRNYEFNLLITPVRELQTSKHFSEVYYHGNPANCDAAAANGCNVFNIHHAQALNPYINYPFVIKDSLIEHIKYQHSKGRKVKLYYTIRELTTHCQEVYAFHSLGHEIFAGGVGYGLPWECEHLVDDYKPAWYTSLENLPDFEPDAALVLTGNSRFINYWLEGLRWMEENYDLDGIYMDDVSFDRTTVKRIRKILDRYHDGALIDLHSNTAYSRGPANQYTEFFPYVDRLWFGESFRYDDMKPDEWFVTFSGIPFGRMSEMLQGGGNRFLGMVFGASSRQVPNSLPVYKFWREFGIKDSKMVGWWSPWCPVKTGDKDVKATVYMKEGETLISVGNFSAEDKTVTLAIDWNAIGIDPSNATIETPAIEEFQSQSSLTPGTPISIKPKEGKLIVIR